MCLSVVDWNDPDSGVFLWLEAKPTQRGGVASTTCPPDAPARPLPAAEAAEPNPPRVASAAVTAHVLAALPKYQPPVASAPPPPAPASTDEAAPPDPEVVALPKFFVEDSRLRHLDPDKLLGQQALTAKMRRDYRKSLGDLEWTLNCFNIPLLTPSVAARARELRRPQVRRRDCAPRRSDRCRPRAA